MGIADVVSPESLVEVKGRYLADLMGRGLEGTADAVVLPSSVDEVAAVTAEVNEESAREESDQ
jgi:hypothetical protein